MPFPDTTNRFRLIQDTKTILKIPNVNSVTTGMKLFNVQKVTTTSIDIVEWKKQLIILDPQKRGDPPVELTQALRESRSIRILHYHTKSRVMGSDVQDRVDFLTGVRSLTVDEAIADAMQHQRTMHTINAEYANLCGFIKGQIVGSDSTKHVDIFDFFGLTQHVVDFPFSDPSFTSEALYLKCLELSRFVKKNLLGDISTGMQVFCAPELTDELIKVLLKGVSGTMTEEKLQLNRLTGILIGGVNFVEYYESLPDLTGNVRYFIDSETGFLFPLGTKNTFTQFQGPPVIDSLSRANVAGEEMYALTVPDRELNSHVDLHVEMDILPFCSRPEALVKLTMS